MHANRTRTIKLVIALTMLAATLAVFAIRAPVVFGAHSSAPVTREAKLEHAIGKRNATIARLQRAIRARNATIVSLTAAATSLRVELARLTGVPASTLPGDGTYAVGSDMSPGLYRTPNPGGLCYWARLSGFSGELRDIIANANPGGPAVVEVAGTDVALESNRCGTWTRVG